MERARRVVLVVTALVYAAIAIASLIAPHRMAAGLGYRLDGATGLSEHRAVYVGLWLATTWIFIMAARSRDPTLHMVCVLLVGGQVLGRVVSLVLDGVPGPSIWPSLAVEVVGTVVLFALRPRATS